LSSDERSKKLSPEQEKTFSELLAQWSAIVTCVDPIAREHATEPIARVYAQIGEIGRQLPAGCSTRMHEIWKWHVPSCQIRSASHLSREEREEVRENAKKWCGTDARQFGVAAGLPVFARVCLANG